MAVWADEGHIIYRLVLLEGLQLLIGLLLVFTVVYFPNKIDQSVLISFCAIKFFLIGANTILAYKLIGMISGSWSKGVILHLLSTPQGSMMFASIIAFMTPMLFNNSFLSMLLLDISSSFLLMYALLHHLRSNLNEIRTLCNKQNIILEINKVLIAMWRRIFFPYNIILCLFCIALSGMVVFSFKIATLQSILSISGFFSISWFFYGGTLWLVSVQLHKGARESILLIMSALLFCAAGLLGLWIEHTGFFNFYIPLYIACCYTNAVWLHLTGKYIIEQTPSHEVAKLRACSFLYLCLIFGFGEWFYAHLLHTGNGMLVWHSLRILLGLLLFSAAVLFLKKRKTHSLVMEQ